MCRKYFWKRNCHIYRSSSIKMSNSAVLNGFFYCVFAAIQGFPLLGAVNTRKTNCNFFFLLSPFYKRIHRVLFDRRQHTNTSDLLPGKLMFTHISFQCWSLILVWSASKIIYTQTHIPNTNWIVYTHTLTQHTLNSKNVSSSRSRERHVIPLRHKNWSSGLSEHI